MTAETRNARWEWVLVPRELLAEARNIAMEWTVRGRVPECGKFGQIAQDLDAMLAAAPPPAAARGDVRYDRELIAQMLDAAEAPAFTMEEMDTQARLLREAAQAKPEARGGGEVAAWETEDGRVISARQKATALRDGGASASSVAPYTTPLYRTAPPSAPVGVEWPLSLLRAGHWREVYIGHRCMRLEVTYDYATWERLMAEVESALAQQPAPPSAPVGVKTLSEFMAEQEALHPGIHDKVQAAADELRASLAQMPAAVDEVHKAIRKVRNIATGAAEHPAQGPKHADGMRRACNIIEAALAAQQQGGVE